MTCDTAECKKDLMSFSFGKLFSAGRTVGANGDIYRINH
jgi:hypothetical protein